MAGFEVVVRPVVFPNIRPAPTRSLPPQDDPEKGFAVIKGNPASSVGLSDNWNVSSSKTRPQESQRRVDEARVYQMDDDGTVNRKNFVDVHAANKVWMVDPSVGRIENNVLVPNQGNVAIPSTYARVQESNNVEIRNRDIIKKNPNYKEGS